MSWAEKIMKAKDTLHFELLAVDVYNDLVENVANDVKYVGWEKKRERLQELLIGRFDETADPFVRVIIGYSLISGIWFIQNGLSTSGKVDKYHGKRFQEISNVTFNSALTVGKVLVEAKTQYSIATSVFNIAANSMFKKKSSELRKLLFNLVSTFDEVVMKNDVRTQEFLILAINHLLDEKSYRNMAMLAIIDSMLDVAISFGDTAPTARSQYNAMGFDTVFPQVFDLKLKFFQKNQDKVQIGKIAISYAGVFKLLAEERAKQGGINLEAAIMHLESAIKVYKQYGLINSEELKITKQRLDELKIIWSKTDNPYSIVRKYNLIDFFQTKRKNNLKNIFRVFLI